MGRGLLSGQIGGMKSLATLALLALTLSACGSSSDDAEKQDPTRDLVPLGKQTAGELSVEMFADEPLHVGLSSVLYRLTSGSKAVESATITQLPIMHMESMGKEHSCPVEGPPPSADARGLFPGLIVFQMAGGSMGSWRNEVSVDLGDGAGEKSVTFPDLSVAESDAKRDLSLPDGKKVLITLNFAGALAVGQNPFTLTLHEKADMHGMSWKPLTDCTVTMTPEMPAMGHGSPDNVSPSHVASGRYQGSVNLIMKGSWKIAFDVARAGAPLGSVDYEVEL